MTLQVFKRFGVAAIAAAAIALTAAGVFGEPPRASADSGYCDTTGYEFDPGSRRFFSYTRPCPGVAAYYYSDPYFYNINFYNNYNYCHWCYGNQFYHGNQFYNFNPFMYTGYRGYGFGGY
jgi:hypothetical protein